MLRSVDLKTIHVQASRYLVELLQRASADLNASSFAGNNNPPRGGGIRGADIYVTSGIRIQVVKEAPYPALLVH